MLFTDGSVDSLVVDPGASLLIGVDLGYHFMPRLSGHLGLSYATADAVYIEDGTLRPDVGVNRTQIDVDVRYDVVARPVDLALGGGLSLGFAGIDGMVWNGDAIRPDSTVLGIHGVGALDVPLGSRLALRVLIRLGIVKYDLGDLERDLARADGEAGASLDADTETEAALAVGVAVSF